MSRKHQRSKAERQTSISRQVPREMLAELMDNFVKLTINIFYL